MFGGLTLDAEAELLLLVGDVAGDSPDESHGQAAGNTGDCSCLHRCACGVQREQGAVQQGRPHHPAHPSTSPMALVVPTSVVVVSATPITCKRCEPVSGLISLCSLHLCARQPEREQGEGQQPGPRDTSGLGSECMFPWGAVSLLSHTSAGSPGWLLTVSQRGLKLLLSPITWA